MRRVSAVVSRGTVTLEASRCKGCELCIPACPPRVLRMSETRNMVQGVLQADSHRMVHDELSC